MELYHLAVLLCLALFDGSAATEKTNGQTCTGEGETCASTHHCDGICKWKIGGTCVTGALECVGGPCTDGNNCACPTGGDFAVASTDSTYCVYSGTGSIKPGVTGCKDAEPASAAEKCDADGTCDAATKNCVITGTGEAKRGAACKAAAAKLGEKCTDVDKCEDDICFVSGAGTSPDGSCDAIPTIADKKCQPGKTCIDGNCKKRVGEQCTAKSTTECLPNASCKGEGVQAKCECNAEHKANTYKTSCDKSGAAGMAASLLLVVSAFLTSRFL